MDGSCWAWRLTREEGKVPDLCLVLIPREAAERGVEVGAVEEEPGDVERLMAGESGKRPVVMVDGLAISCRRRWKKERKGDEPRNKAGKYGKGGGRQVTKSAKGWIWSLGNLRNLGFGRDGGTAGGSRTDDGGARGRFWDCLISGSGWRIGRFKGILATGRFAVVGSTPGWGR